MKSTTTKKNNKKKVELARTIAQSAIKMLHCLKNFLENYYEYKS